MKKGRWGREEGGQVKEERKERGREGGNEAGRGGSKKDRDERN